MCLLCFHLRINNMDEFRAPVAGSARPEVQSDTSHSYMFLNYHK